MSWEVDWSILRDEKLRAIVKRAMTVVKELEAEQKPWRDFEYEKVGANWWDFQKLVRAGIFRLTTKSRSHRFYKFAAPLEEVEKVINEIESLSPEKLAVLEEEKTEDIPPDFWETIEGYDDIKEVFLASLRAHDPVHILLVGPPATAKSLMLMEVERLQGSVFVTMGTATKVGLRDMLLEWKPRILIIDELDKLSSPDDISVLLTLMESQRVVVTKHKEYREEKLKTWVFAAANKTRGLPPELLDRFQVFYLRPYDKETLRRVIINCLIKREGTSHELAAYIAERVVEAGGTVREAIRLARLSKTREDVDRYHEIMSRYSLRS